MTRLTVAVILSVIFAVIVAGCSTTSTSTAPATATDTATFISAANNCQATNLTVTNSVGTFSYESTPDCTLLKTLVKMNGTEMPEIKTMLEGKSMVCGYTKGNFDSRWVTTLIGGMETCHGPLRDGLAQLIIFTSS